MCTEKHSFSSHVCDATHYSQKCKMVHLRHFMHNILFHQQMSFNYTEASSAEPIFNVQFSMLQESLICHKSKTLPCLVRETFSDDTALIMSELVDIRPVI